MHGQGIFSGSPDAPTAKLHWEIRARNPRCEPWREAQTPAAGQRDLEFYLIGAVAGIIAVDPGAFLRACRYRGVGAESCGVAPPDAARARPARPAARREQDRSARP